MAYLGSAFDANSVEPNQPFDVIPAGKYKVQIVDSDVKPTKTGDGAYIWLELEILEGEFQGRKLWDRINIQNPNEETVKIAQRTLSALCHACGKLQVENTEDLHFAPVIATVRVRPANEKYDASNDIRGYASVSGAASAPAPRAAAPVANAPAPQTGGAVPPWKARRAG